MDISKICVIKSILYNLSSNTIKNHDHFCTNLIQALNGFINSDKQNKFANKILEIANIYIANPSKAEFIYFNETRDVIEIYDTIQYHNNHHFNNNEQQLNDSNNDINSIILTGQIRFYLDMLRKFLTNTNNIPFIIIGPSGSGKTLLIQSIISELSGYQLITLKCSSQLTPNYIIYFLKQVSK